MSSRKKCDCMGQVHGLVNNCLGCGRVVCEQEGEGNCIFCGNSVLKNEHMDEEEENLKLIKDLENDPSLTQTYFIAVEHKARLVNQDKDKGQRNMIDEDADWYEIKSDVWQTDEVRKRAMQHMLIQEDEEKYAKETVKTSINFMTGEMEEEKIKFDDQKHKKLIQDILREDLKEQTLEDTIMKQEQDKRLKQKEQELLAAIREDFKTKVEVKPDKASDEKKPQIQKPLSQRVDNDDCYEQFLTALNKMGDAKHPGDDENLFDRMFYKLSAGDNKCLSMWQPWASLLIYGFKRYEGRVWDTNYRGPLWIHAGAKEPDPTLIKTIEAQYRKIYDGLDLPPFPQSYPTGCLIGVCDLQDVIDQKMYTEFVPKKYTGESTEEHLFVIRNPRKLMVNIRCAGNKGIFDLSETIISSALHTLKRIPTSWFPYYADKFPSAKQEPVNPAIKKEEAAEPREAPKKSVEEMQSFSDGKRFKMQPWLEEKMEEFVKAFEKYAQKRIEKGKEGLIGTKIDEFLISHQLLEAALAELLKDSYDISRDAASKAMPKSFDLFALTKNTKKFVLPANYSFVLLFGKKCDFTTEKTKAFISMESGNILIGSNMQTSIKGLEFHKMTKLTTQTGMQCQTAEALVLAFN